MGAIANTLLQFILFSELTDWSVQTLINTNVKYSDRYKLVKIGYFLKKAKNIINVEDNTEYKRVTVKINNNGVTLRNIEKGINIGTKKQFLANEGQFIISRIDARNGAFGIIPPELEGAVVTNDFPLFHIDTTKINPFFLVLITTTKEFIKFAQSCSSGTTNRQRIDIGLFLNQKIPLPTLSEQDKLVNDYAGKINKAKDLEQEANGLEGEIEKYFLEQLGLTSFSLKEKVTTLQITDFSTLDKWNFSSTDIRIINELKKSKFQLSSIGKSFKFVKRGFNKAHYKEETFRYIEIGAIDPIKGILEAKEVEIKKAPSRATQIVKNGDFIIGMTRPYLKKFAIVTEEYDNNICSSGFCMVQQSENYYLPFLHQFLKCSYGIEQLKNKMTGGLYPAITEEELKEIKIPIPILEKQIEIMNLIEMKKQNILDNKNIVETTKHEAIQTFENAIFNS